jgi:hypothetical protein
MHVTVEITILDAGTILPENATNNATVCPNRQYGPVHRRQAHRSPRAGIVAGQGQPRRRAQAVLAVASVLDVARFSAQQARSNAGVPHERGRPTGVHCGA